MNQRRLLLVSISIVAIALVGGFWTYWSCERPALSAITRANGDKIETGMTLADVETVLGGPPRSVCTGPTVYEFMNSPGPAPGHLINGRTAGQTTNWVADDVAIEVGFNIYGRVTSVSIQENFLTRDESLLEKLRRWIGL